MASDQKTPISGADAKQPKSSILGTKRRVEWALDVLSEPKSRRPRMDDRSFMTTKCCGILSILMEHSAASLFSDANGHLKVPLKYRSSVSKTIISDWQTIKSNLENSIYESTEEFESDVRLILSSAMLYNSQRSPVHVLAKKLNGIFNSLWTPDHGHSLNTTKLPRTDHVKKIDEKSDVIKSTSGLGKSSSTKKSSARAINDEPKDTYPVEVGVEEKLQMSDIKDTKVGKPKLIRRSVYNNISARCKTDAAAQVRCCIPPQSVDEYPKETTRQLTGKLQANIEPHEVSMPSNCSTSRNMRPKEENTCAPVDAAASAPLSEGQEAPVSTGDPQLSPEKALRLAKLKLQCLDTIFKAKEWKMSHNVHKVDGITSTTGDEQEEEKKKILEERHKEKARLETAIKSLEKQRLQRQRAAARLKLEEMVGSVDDNLSTMRQFEELIGVSTCYCARQDCTPPCQFTWA